MKKKKFIVINIKVDIYNNGVYRLKDSRCSSNQHILKDSMEGLVFEWGREGKGDWEMGPTMMMKVFIFFKHDTKDFISKSPRFPNVKGNNFSPH
jgi:hypothetical protein